MIPKNSYTSLPKIFFDTQNPEIFPHAKKYVFNSDLATELGLDNSFEEEILSIFTDREIIKKYSPFAEAYAGHQFGHFTMLGDGRAMILSEQKDRQNQLYDIAFKGSGRTRYSRGGDGRASLKSVLREYIFSEAMYGLGIPTSRSLSLTVTGENIYRQEVEQGAILTRILPSHIRVGTFEFARVYASKADFDALFHFTMRRHFPDCEVAPNPVKAFLQKVIELQTTLVAEWMRVGFIHGVMNTDNTSICGYTFDYGPCAFLNAYNSDQAFSSIDREGRYSFQNQRSIIIWNLTNLISCFDRHLTKEELQEMISSLHQTMEQKYYDMMANKLGITIQHPEDTIFIDDFLKFLEENKMDYTNTFAYLSGYKYISDTGNYTDKKFLAWLELWHARMKKEQNSELLFQNMKKYNPYIIPRNHVVEEVIEACGEGDKKSLFSFLEILKNPYEYKKVEKKYLLSPDGHDQRYQTFCGT